jgi:hypothetical protein
LDVNGNALFRFPNANVQFGTPGGETGMTIIGTNRADARFDGTTFKLLAGLGSGAPPSTNGLAVNTDGNVGIGTTTPLAGYRLDTFGAVRSFGDSTQFVAQTTGGTNSFARFHMRSPNRGWYIGTSQNFNNDQFYLVDETAGQIRMAVATDGNVGIGTTTPNSGRLHVQSASNTGVYGQTASGSIASPGVQGVSTGAGGVGVRGDGTTGVYGVSNSGVGVTGESASGFAMYANGSVGQARDKGGYVKALLYVNFSGVIVRCYNGVTGESTGTCGFGVTRTALGTYDVVSGFQTSDRFVSVTAEYGISILGSDDNLGANFFFLGQNTIRVFTFLSSQPNDLIDAPFMLILY